jgi:hypothetical protein
MQSVVDVLVGLSIGFEVCPLIGVQNSYDLLQAISTCAIHPVYYEAGANVFGEAKVRTSA